MGLSGLEVDRLFLESAIYQASDNPQCQRADAEHRERAHENLSGPVGHCEPRPQSHIGGKAHGTFGQQGEKRAGDDDASRFSGTNEP